MTHEDARREAEIRDYAVYRSAHFKDESWEQFLIRLLDAERANSEGLRKALTNLAYAICDGEEHGEGADETDCLICHAIRDATAALSASPSPTLPNTRMGEVLTMARTVVAHHDWDAQIPTTAVGQLATALARLDASQADTTAKDA